METGTDPKVPKLSVVEEPTRVPSKIMETAELALKPFPITEIWSPTFPVVAPAITAGVIVKLDVALSARFDEAVTL
jgi:hypothetical protein